MMKSSDPYDDDLRSRFLSLRSAEQKDAPSFRATLAAARCRKSLSIDPKRLLWGTGILAGATSLALVLILAPSEEEPPKSLAKAIPTLLPPGSERIVFFPGPLISEATAPSDILLPLSSRFPL